MTRYDTVSVIGLGKVGLPIARSLLATGRPLTVWNRTSSRSDALAAEGAGVVPSARDAVAAGDLTFLLLTDHDATMTVLRSAADALPGKALVNLTTMSPREAREASDWASQHGADYLQGAMMALPDTLGTSSAFFVYSGAGELDEVHPALLSGVASHVYLGSDPASASYYDAALLGVVYAMLSGFLQSLALVEALGVGPTTFADHAMTWAGGMIPYLGVMAGEVERSDFSDGASSVSMNLGAVENIVAASTEHGVPAEILRPLQGWLEAAVGAGRGGESFASLIRQVRQRSG